MKAEEREPGELQGAQVERPSLLAPLLTKRLPCRSCGRLAPADRLRPPKEPRKLGRLGLRQRLERCQQIQRFACLILQRKVRPPEPDDEVPPTLGDTSQRTAAGITGGGDR